MSTDALSSGAGTDKPKIRRLNKLPVYAFFAIAVVLIGVVFWGLAGRGFKPGGDAPETANGESASNFADELKRGVSDGVIDEQRAKTATAPPPDADKDKAQEEQPEYQNPFQPQQAEWHNQAQSGQKMESEAEWRERLAREQEEQQIRLLHQQKMARLQAHEATYDSPIAVSIDQLRDAQDKAGQAGEHPAGNPVAGIPGSAADLYAAALRAAGGGGQTTDPGNQLAKENFFDKNSADLGYLPNRVVPQQSPFELKRGSVIPATLVTGINSDLPGRITAQVSQNIYDSATGHRLLIPQGAKLFGRYDSKVSFGQSRVLVIWTDIIFIFPDGATLQIGGMAGVDAEGYGGFRDKVDRKYLQTFGSAILVALIGAGIDMAAPPTKQSSSGEAGNNPTDAARRSFVETFGRVAERTISRNMDVQPTLTIRPGYGFNVIVEQDMIFPGDYRS